MEPNNPPSPTDPASVAAADSSLPAETLPAVLLRRTRYALTIVLCGLLLLWVLWPLLAPPPQYAGLTLLAWPGAGAGAGIGVLVVAVLACVAVAMFLTHPDAPHTGLYCALLGLAALAIRGGTGDLLLATAERTGGVAAVAGRLAGECLIWAGLVVGAEVVSRGLFGRFFANTSWITRNGMPLDVVEPLVISLPGVRTTVRTAAPHRDPAFQGSWFSDAAALLLTTGLAIILLSILMQSQEKGQVLFSCFASFALATLGASYAFPKARSWAYWLAVPLTALVGYLVAMRLTPAALAYPPRAGVYPGLWPTALARALPIDYITAGVPGAILGYYTGLKMRMHHRMEEAEAIAS